MYNWLKFVLEDVLSRTEHMQNMEIQSVGQYSMPANRILALPTIKEFMLQEGQVSNYTICLEVDVSYGLRQQ